MELKVKSITLPEAIEFNFDELKGEIQAKTDEYKGIVYTDKEIKEAKADVAKFRKLKTAINDEKIRVKKECLKPYEDFENKVRELMLIIDEPINSISTQITQYEDDRKFQKREEINEYWLQLMDEGLVPNGISLMQIMDEKWLNASVKMGSVKDEIDYKIQEIRDNLRTLADLPEFGFEATEVYKTTLNMNKAISEGKRLAEIQKRKAEMEKSAESEIVKEVEAIITATQEPVELKFWVKVTPGQAQGLRMYLELNEIEFGQIERW